MFIICDETHAEYIGGKFATFESALSDICRIAEIPFGTEPNVPPCTGWRRCRRKYQIIEFDDSQEPWQLITTTNIVTITALEINWHYDKPVVPKRSQKQKPDFPFSMS